MVEWGKGEPVEAWQDRMLDEQGIAVAFPKQTERADAWLAGVKRMTDLREQTARGEPPLSAAEQAELDDLWRRYTPLRPPKLPTSSAACMAKIVETKERLDDPRTSDLVFNRLSWLFADLINLMATNVEKGVWIGDDRLRGWVNPAVDGSHRGAGPPGE